MEYDAEAIAKRVDLITNLFSSVSDGDLINVKSILNDRFSIQTFKNLSPTLLHQAANNKHCNVLKYLIDHGAYVDSKNAQSMTALHVASNKGDARSVRMLLENNADVNALDYDNRTPLYYASYDGHNDVVDAILQNDSLDLKIMRNGGWTPLHETSRCGHYYCSKVLIGAGVSVFAKTDDALWTPGHMASSCGNVECLRLLIHAGIDVNAGAGPNKSSTLLHEAAQMGHYACVDLLLKSGANPSLYSGQDLAHHLASRHGHSKVLDVILQNLKDNEKSYLIDAFTNVDPISNALTYHNALHMSALYGRYECIEVLLKHNAKHLPNGMKNYPLMLAAHKVHLLCMRLLLTDMKLRMQSNNTDVLQSQVHYSALHYLCMKTYKTTEKTIACACLLLNSGIIDINQEDLDWDIAPSLYIAARNGAIGLVQYLLTSGANPYICGSLKNYLLNNPNVKQCSELIDEAKEEAKSLMSLCRLKLRDVLITETSLEKCYELPVPKFMRHYIYHGHRVTDDACSYDAAK